MRRGSVVADYPVVDLTTYATSSLEARATVDPSNVARQLKDITDAIAPVLDEAQPQKAFGLDTIELSLTIGAEGGIWFVAKGSAEASITVTFKRTVDGAAD
jgi:Trypsin-co-occurring domain 1